MSYQTQNASDSDTSRERPRLGSRDNYWGGVEEPTSEAYDVDDEGESDNQTTHAGVARDRWIAGSILRGAPETTILCPECWTELTDPEHYVEPSELELEDGTIEIRYADHRRHRHCPSCSEIAWGGVLADVEASIFLAIVDRVLDALDQRRYLGDRLKTQLRGGAASRKSEGLSDEANLERLLIDLRIGLQND